MVGRRATRRHYGRKREAPADLRSRRAGMEPHLTGVGASDPCANGQRGLDGRGVSAGDRRGV